MIYSDNSLSDLTQDNIEGAVKSEATIMGGSAIFRGKSYSDWYELAYDAYESWFDGDRWGRLFESIAEILENLELDNQSDFGVRYDDKMEDYLR